MEAAWSYELDDGLNIRISITHDFVFCFIPCAGCEGQSGVRTARQKGGVHSTTNNTAVSSTDLLVDAQLCHPRGTSAAGVLPFALARDTMHNSNETETKAHGPLSRSEFLPYVYNSNELKTTAVVPWDGEQYRR